jgi:N-acetylmuramoyl-L-alanine amidase
MLSRTWKNVCVVLIILLAGCARPPKQTVVVPIGNEYVLAELAKGLDIEYGIDSISQGVFVARGESTAKGLIGSEVMILDGEKILLDAQIRFENGQIIVPKDFKAKIVDRMLAKIDRARLFTLRKVGSVVVDAGHGGKDPGAIGPSGVYEKDIVLDIAKKLKKILERKGIKVIMTREKDEFISLKDRTVLASNSKADLFVSVHANAHDKRSVNGVEVYTLRDLDVFEKNEAQRQENHDTFYSRLDMKENDTQLKAILSDMLYDYKQAESMRLARDTAKGVADFVSAKDLGQKSSRFFVLRNTLVPAILIEVGYLTNPKEEKMLKTDAYRQRVAYAIAQSILEFANGR